MIDEEWVKGYRAGFADGYKKGQAVVIHAVEEDAAHKAADPYNRQGQGRDCLTAHTLALQAEVYRLRARFCLETLRTGADQEDGHSKPSGHIPKI